MANRLPAPLTTLRGPRRPRRAAALVTMMVAVGVAACTAPPAESAITTIDSQDLPPIDNAVVDVTDTYLVVTVVGSPANIGQPCGTDYNATATETPTSVLVALSGRRNTAYDGGCPAVGERRLVSVRLSTPLGSKSLVDARTSHPIPVTTATG